MKPMAGYVAISESEMSDFMNAIGFTELSVEQRGSFGRRPIKERVYETPVGAGRIRVYSSVVGPTTRDRGKDAIRVQYWVGDQKVYGAKRVHRTQNWRKNLLQRTEEIRESAESGPLSRIPKDSRGDLMTARRGRLAHERFWGSVNYPELRESRRFEAVSVLPRGLKTDKITDRVMAIQYMMDDSEKQQKLLKLQTALKMGLITEDEILESLERAMSMNAESNVERKTEKEELILEHLNNNRQTSKYDGKFENTEGGIVELLGITRSGVSRTLRNMESKGLIYARNLHVPGGRRKVQCWYVVGSGTDRGFGAEGEELVSCPKCGYEPSIEYELGDAYCYTCEVKVYGQDVSEHNDCDLKIMDEDAINEEYDFWLYENHPDFCPAGWNPDEDFEAESFKPPASAIAAAKKGLAQRKKWGRGGLSPAEAKSQGIDSGVTRARKIASGKVSKHDVRRMSAFNRHRKNNRPEKKMPDGGPTAGTIAWNLWGGTSGVNWAKKKSANMNAEEQGCGCKNYTPDFNRERPMLTDDDEQAVIVPITCDDCGNKGETVYLHGYNEYDDSNLKWFDAEASDSYDNLAHQDEMAQEAYEEYVEELDPETDYPPMSFEEWYEQTMAIYDTPEYDQYLEQQYLQMQEDAKELARLEALEKNAESEDYGVEPRWM